MEPLHEAERRAVDGLRAERPDLVQRFLQQLPTARAATLERLVGELIRERTDAVVAAGAGPGLVATVREATATGRLELTGPVRFRDAAGAEHPVEHPVDAWRLLREHGLPTGTADQLTADVAADLADSVCHHAIALVGARLRRQELAASGRADVLALARARRAADPSFSALAFFEQWVIDGHPAHYGAKIKRGLAVGDAPRYAPEWGACFVAPLVAVRRDHVAGPDGGRGLAALLAAEHPDPVREARAELRGRGLDPDEHVLLPAHPWQVASTLPGRFGAQLAAGTVVALTAGVPVRPSMSFRTLAPVPTAATPFPSHLKTSVDIRLTMAVRGVSAHAVENGPRLTALLGEVFRREPDLAGRLTVAAEPVAAAFRPGPDEDPALGGSLGVIARANPEAALAADELALPVAALYAASPLTGRPIVADALDELARSAGLPSRSAAAAEFATRYARLALPPLLTLLTRYGIALEAHPQNTVLVLRGGAPVRLVVRDFGGVRILPSRLAAQGLAVPLRPGSAVVAADERELRDKLAHALLTNHVGEVLAAVGAAAGVAQRDLWTPFGEVARATFDALDDPQAAADRRALLHAPLPVKAFLRMRLAGAVTDSLFVDGPNPLRRRVRRSRVPSAGAPPGPA